MKILFLCGCLEPGKDGVGDYTRLLAGKLMSHDNEVVLLAINDPYVMSLTCTSENHQNSFEVCRIPAGNNKRSRFLTAKKKIIGFHPQWISLQYVPYSFHSKGIDLKLPFFTANLKENFHWHLMVHEPWVTSIKTFSRPTIVEYIQKNLLRFLVKTLKPAVIHTSNVFYKEILNSAGIKTSLLHLPGNIPVTRELDPKIIQAFAEIGITDANRSDWLVLGTFGKIRLNISYKIFFQEFLNSLGRQEKKIVFISIGNSGQNGDTILYELEQEFKERILIKKFGQREPSEISTFFQLLDYGIASVPKHLVGKSGAYAAMRNHDVKILVPEAKDELRRVKGQALGCDTYLSDLPNTEFSAEKVAEKMLESLDYHSQKLL